MDTGGQHPNWLPLLQPRVTSCPGLLRTEMFLWVQDLQCWSWESYWQTRRRLSRLVSFLFPKRIQHVPASGPLHVLLVTTAWDATLRSLHGHHICVRQVSAKVPPPR